MTRFCSKHLIALASVLLAGCADVDFDEANEKSPEFRGAVSLFWVRQRDAKSGSEGQFIYIPTPGNELSLIRDADQKELEKITPDALYTDGGSVPRAFQAFKGFSPWAYGPVYLVHDWLFAAKRCAMEPDATDEEKKVLQFEFQDTVDIFVEALVALQRANRIDPEDFSQRSVSAAIAGPISRNLWETPSACVEPDLETIDLARGIVQARSQKGVLRTQGAETEIGATSVRFVTEFSF